MIDVDWRQPFIDYIREQTVPADKNLAEQLIRWARSYVLVGDKLYRRGATSGGCSRGPNLSKLCVTCLFLRVTDLGEAIFIYLGYSPW